MIRVGEEEIWEKTTSFDKKTIQFDEKNHSIEEKTTRYEKIFLTVDEK